jgi:hypothetical protein
MARRLLYLSFLIFCFLDTIAQDDILFMSGKTDHGIITDTTGNSVKYTYLSKKGKQREAEIEKERIFSITYKGGSEIVLYTQDTANGGDFSESEMRYFIMGEQDADKGYKSPWATVGAVAAGLGGGLTGSLIFVPLIPGLYAAVAGSRWIKIKRTTVSTQDALKQQAYLLGYERVARSKRIQNVLKGAGIGLVAGLATYVFVLSDSK